MRIALALLVTLLLAAPASAIYVETPLRLTTDQSHRQVGDDVEVHAEPSNETVERDLAGRTLRIVYTMDGEEDAEPVRHDAGEVTLDDAARGSFRWTVPAEAQDRNVWLALLDGEETVGTLHLAIGDAPPILMATGGSPSGGEGVPEDEPVVQRDDLAAESTNDAPGFTALALVGAAVLAVLALGRRTR